jgi:hypothetical protein
MSDLSIDSSLEEFFSVTDKGNPAMRQIKPEYLVLD